MIVFTQHHRATCHITDSNRLFKIILSYFLLIDRLFKSIDASFALGFVIRYTCLAARRAWEADLKVDETKFVAAQELAQCQIETLAISDQFAQTRMAAAMQQDQEVAGGLQVQVESSF